MSAHAKTQKPNGQMGEKAATGKLHRSHPAHAVPPSAQVALKCQFPNGDGLNPDESSSKGYTDITPSEKKEWAAAPAGEPKMQARPSGSAATGGATRAAARETNEEGGQNAEGKDAKAPLELMTKFLEAVRGRNFKLAGRLCQMILLHEPDNPEASEFLTLLDQKWLRKSESDSSDEEDDDDSESDEEAPLSPDEDED